MGEHDDFVQVGDAGEGTTLIPVTKTDVQAAKLRIKVDRQRGVQTPAAIRKLANARRATDKEAAEPRIGGQYR